MKLIYLNLLLIIVFITVSHKSEAQTQTDSLLHLLSEVKNEQKADVLIELCKAYAGRDNNTSMYYGQECLKLSDSIGYLFGKSEAYSHIGIAYYYQSRYPEALSELKKAFLLKAEVKDSANLGNILLLQGVIYAHFADHNQAIEKYTNALEIYESINDTNGISSCYSNIGLIHQEQGGYEKAIGYMEKSAKLQLELKNQIKVAKNYNNLGVVYEQIGSLHRAMEYYQKAVEIYEKEDFLQSLAITYNNIGSVYTKEGRFDKALYFLNKSLNAQKQLNSVKGQSSTLLNMAKLFKKKKDYFQTQKHLAQALSLSDSSNYQTKKLEVFHEYYQLFSEMHNHEKALEYHIKYVALNDTITKNKHKENVLRLQTLFETEQKDKEIKLLNVENESKATQIKRQKTINYLQAAFLLSILVMAFLIYRMYQRKKKISKVLEEQNKYIKEQSNEIKSQNEQLEIQTFKLKELDKMKSVFFANISHEFRTPLTLILGPAEQLYKKLESDKQPDMELIIRQARRLKQLIDQLLEIAKIEKGAMQLKASKSNISVFIRTMISAFDSWASEKKLKLEFNSSPKDIVCTFDKDKMEKIINNLLSNAIKFSQAEGIINVDIQEVNSSVRIKIKDTGKGIEQDEIANIFDRFYSMHGEADSIGTGIGLSLTKELVELHKGKIDVESEIGKGTQFVIMLPVGQSTDDEHIDENADKTIDPFILENSPNDEKIDLVQTIDKNAKTVLIVEDNTDMQKYIASSLSNFNILFAANGKKGIETAVESNPDLIISDIMMPVMDGYEMTRELKNNDPTSHIPILMLTAKASQESLLQGFECEADDYLTKPFNANELNARVTNLIKIREKLIAKFKKTISVVPSEITTTSLDESFLQNALKIIEENIMVSDFSVEDFIKIIGMSRTSLHRKLKSLTGLSATEFIRSIKLKRAAQLIIGQAGSISEIAYMAGFNNLSYFTKCFKEEFNCAPSEYNNASLKKN